MPLPLKSESHATRYRTSPSVGLTMVLSALGQMLDGFELVDDVEVEGVVLAVLVDDGVDAEAETEVDDADVDVGEEGEVMGAWLALSVGASHSGVSMSVKGKLLLIFKPSVSSALTGVVAIGSPRLV